MTDTPLTTSHRDDETGLLICASPAVLEGWEVAAEVDDSGPLPEVIGLTVRRFDHPAGVGVRMGPPASDGLTARHLRHLPLGRLLEGVNFNLRARHLMAGEQPRLIDPAQSNGREVTKALRAAEYWRACATTRAPRKVLAESWGMTTTQVRDLVYRLRETGYLEGSRRGQAGAALTDKTLTLLDRAGGEAAKLAASYRETATA